MWLRKHKKEIEPEIALQKAKENLKETQARAPDVTKTAEAFRTLRERNHFAEQLASIMGGSK